VLVQAGSSEDGKTLASKFAEVIFTIQRDITEAKAFYADIKSRAAAFGRDPAHALVLPGVMPVVGRTRQEAQDKYGELQALIHPEAGLAGLSRTLETDLRGVDVDGPLPPINIESLSQSRAVGMVEAARRDNLTVRQVYERLLVSKGHRQLIGSATEIADSLQEWFEGGACDGFNIMPAMMAGGLPDFVELVVPELQRRGVFRRAYEGVTLRDHLGLPRPGAIAPSV
jgi:alkanesulfonate monooxygenase SsuD/methylene tetrahydromethanopterin reductase-like flavin-dependent oxidoreductase (luciferase family)